MVSYRGDLQVVLLEMFSVTGAEKELFINRPTHRM